MPVNSSRRVELVGFPTIHQKLLKNQLSPHFEICAYDSLADISIKSDESSVIVVLQQGFGSQIRDQLIALRTQRFVWSPVIILQSKRSVADDSSEWSIWYRDFPPDITEMTSTIDLVHFLTLERRNEIVRSSILQMHTDLSFLRAGSYQSTDDDVMIRKEIREIDLLIGKECALNNILEFINLIASLRNAAELPSIDQNMIADLRTSVVQAETIARENEASVKLRSRLHQFSNSLRYSEWVCATSSERTIRIAETAHSMPRDLAEILMPGATAFLDKLECLIEQLKDTNGISIQELLLQSSDLFNAFNKTVATVRSGDGCVDDLDIKRIILIEDDKRWHLQIRLVLQEVAPGMEIIDVYDYHSARNILCNYTDGTLVILDLGLPIGPSTEADVMVDLDAGLKLMRKCEQSGSRTRFLVLTAAQNYSQAVRDSLTMGVQPSDYIQKDPLTWEQQLRSRLQIALSRKKFNLSNVDVFRCTARLIRVNGIEILLERKPYVVLEYLALHARVWCTIDQMRSNLTQPGDRDITPCMSKEQLLQLDNGARITPYAMLTPKHIQDYVYDIRQRIDEAFTNSGVHSDVPDIISYNADLNSYRLLANVQICDKLEDLIKADIPKRILVVEDHPDWSKNISSQLASLSFEVRTANTLRQFEETTRDWIPDIVTLDLQIPVDDRELSEHEAHERNGLKVLKTLKDRYPEIRIVVLTSIAWNDSVMLGILRNGVIVDDYLDKKWDNAIERLTQSIWRLSLEVQHGSRIPTSFNLGTVTSVSLQTDNKNTIKLGGIEVTLSDLPARVFRMLAASPNAPVDRDTIVDELWATEDLSDTYEDNLNTIIRRLRTEITKKTDDHIDGKKLVRSADGVYWLHGVVTT